MPSLVYMACRYESQLATQMYKGLSEIPGIRIFGPPPSVPQGRAAVISFLLPEVDMMVSLT